MSADARRERRVVQRRDHEAAGIGARAEQRQHLVAMPRVEVVGRLVEQANRGVLGEQRRDVEAPPLAAGERIHRALGERREPDGRERIARRRKIAGIFPLPERQVRMPADQRGLEHGRRETDLRSVAAAGRDAARARGPARREVAPVELHAPAAGARRPASVCRVSVLPTPLRPSTAMNSPPCGSNSRPRTSVRPAAATSTRAAGERGRCACSGLQPLVPPWLGLEAAVAAGGDHARPARAVVQPMLALAPELDGRGPQPVAAPVRRPRQPQSRLHVVFGRRQRIRRAEALAVSRSRSTSSWREATGALCSLVIAARRLRQERLAK